MEGAGRLNTRFPAIGHGRTLLHNAQPASNPTPGLLGSQQHSLRQPRNRVVRLLRWGAVSPLTPRGAPGTHLVQAAESRHLAAGRCRAGLLRPAANRHAAVASRRRIAGGRPAGLEPAGGTGLRGPAECLRAGGARAGATIVTHRANQPFYERAWAAPHTRQPMCQPPRRSAEPWGPRLLGKEQLLHLQDLLPMACT